MNNLFTYVIELRDKMSPTFRRVGGSINDTHKKVQKLRDEVKSLNDTPLRGLKTSFTGLFNNIPFARYIFNPFLIAGIAGGRALKLGIDEEMRSASFEVLFEGADNAKKIIDEVDSYSKKTTYGKESISSAIQTMSGFGVMQESIMPNLKAIGDIAMGNKGRFDSLTLAFSQMDAIGTLMGQDLNQMINAGFNPLQQMAKDTGKSVGELKEMMGKGLITSNMVAEAFQNATREGGMFYGMSEKMANTFGGQVSLSIANINDKLLGLYNIIQPILLPALQSFNLLITDFPGFIDSVVDRLGKMNIVAKILGGTVLTLSAAIGVIKVVTLAYGGVVQLITMLKSAETLAWIANTMAMWANPVTWITALVLALIGVIAYLIIKVDGWGETWDNVIKFCKLAFQSFKENLVLQWLVVQDVFMTGLELIQKGWYKLKSLWDKDAANEGLASIEAQRNERLKSIAEQQGKLNELKEEMSKMEVFKLKVNDTSLGDVISGLKAKVGISDAGVPGMNNTGDNTAGQLMPSGKTSQSNSTAKSITTGGSKTTHITVNVGELGNRIVINSGNIREGATKVRDIVLDELTRALSMAQANV